MKKNMRKITKKITKSIKLWKKYLLISGSLEEFDMIGIVINDWGTIEINIETIINIEINPKSAFVNNLAEIIIIKNEKPLASI